MKDTGEFLGVELLIECSSCAAPTPVNRPEERTRSSNCQHDTNVDFEAWSAALKDAHKAIRHLGVGVTESGKLDRPGRNAEWNRGPARPNCPSCDTPMRASADLTRAACPACKATRSVEPLPEFLKGVMRALAPPSESAFVERAPEIVSVVSEAAEPDTAGAAKELSLACTKCGASISSDGTKRTVDCTYCKATNILPEEVWRALHPPKLRRKIWFLMTPDPRRALDKPGERLLKTVILSALILPWVSACGASMSSSIVNGNHGDNRFLIHFATWILASILLFVAPAVRDWWRARDVVSKKNEIVGRLGEWAASKVTVELFHPGDLSVSLGTRELELPEENFKMLGGAGGFIRAWAKPNTTKFEIRPQPSGLV